MNGEQHGKASKVKILIVEDQMPVAMMMTFLLARAGCELNCNNRRKRNAKGARWQL